MLLTLLLLDIIYIHSGHIVHPVNVRLQCFLQPYLALIFSGCVGEVLKGLISRIPFLAHTPPLPVDNGRYPDSQYLYG